MSGFPFNRSIGYVKQSEGLPGEFGNTTTLSEGHDGGIMQSILSAKYEITQPFLGQEL